MGLAGARAEASEALQTQINAGVTVNTRVIEALECGSHRSDEYDGQPHRLLYAPRNSGSVRLKARRRAWSLSASDPGPAGHDHPLRGADVGVYYGRPRPIPRSQSARRAPNARETTCSKR